MMLKKSVIWRVSLLILVVVMVNLYLGCVHKYYTPGYAPGGEYQTKDGAQLQEQDRQIEEMKKEIEELKKNQ